jgi:hypothetical protein
VVSCGASPLCGVPQRHICAEFQKYSRSMGKVAVRRENSEQTKEREKFPGYDVEGCMVACALGTH